MCSHPYKDESRMLSDKELRQLLSDLDAEISARGIFPEKYQLSMFAVGGAVLALEWGHRMTHDLDIISEGLTVELRRLIADVGKRYYVRADWLNDGAKAKMPDVRSFGTKPKVLFEGENIIIYGAEVELIIAMKLVSGREVDLEDILFLLQKTSIKTCDELLDLIQKAYPHTWKQLVFAQHFAEVVAEEAGLVPLRRPPP